MASQPQLLLIGAVAAVGVLHTIVPDHWVPLTVMARQRGWSKAETAWAALRAGTGHVVSTLTIALAVWIGGAALAVRFGAFIDTLSSAALVGFGLWVAISAWHEMGHGHGHPHPVPTPWEEARRPDNRRSALLLILGSSPMVEGIPAFFAAGKYGPGLIAAMAVIFAVSTIATYVLLSVGSATGLQRLRLGAMEQYGEMISGGAIALVGLAFWWWPTGW